MLSMFACHVIRYHSRRSRCTYLRSCQSNSPPSLPLHLLFHLSPGVPTTPARYPPMSTWLLDTGRNQSHRSVGESRKNGCSRARSCINSLIMGPPHGMIIELELIKKKTRITARTPYMHFDFPPVQNICAAIKRRLRPVKSCAA